MDERPAAALDFRFEDFVYWIGVLRSPLFGGKTSVIPPGVQRVESPSCSAQSNEPVVDNRSLVVLLAARASHSKHRCDLAGGPLAADDTAL